MSKYAKFNVEFESTEKCAEAFEIFQNFQDNAQKRYLVFKPDYDSTVSTHLQSLEDQGETSISFELCSTRERNLDWQVQMGITLLKEVGSIEELIVDIWVDTDGFYFDAENDSLNDYEPDLR